MVIDDDGMHLRLTPILPVDDVREELTFYLQLGFQQHTDPDETYPVDTFVAVSHGDSILFGLAASDTQASVPPKGLQWQFETTDLDAVNRAAGAAGIEISVPITLQAWGRRVMTVKSPSGYTINFEES